MYNDSFKERYKIAPVAISKNTNGEDTEIHIHNEIEILYITDGSTIIKIGEESINATKSDLIFINPFEIHSLKTITKNNYKHKCICFDLSLLADSNIAKKLQNGSLYITHKPDKICIEELKNLFLKLHNATEKSDNTLLFESTAYISLIFTQILKNGLLNQSDKTKKNADFCKKAIKYISKNFNEQITSKNAAEELFFTQSYFCRNFKDNFSSSFSEYLNLYRISVAKNMLQTTNEKISEISHLCGFSSPEYFIRLFKKHVGILPEKYRKKSI